MFSASFLALLLGERADQQGVGEAALGHRAAEAVGDRRLLAQRVVEIAEQIDIADELPGMRGDRRLGRVGVPRPDAEHVERVPDTVGDIVPHELDIGIAIQP